MRSTHSWRARVLHFNEGPPGGAYKAINISRGGCPVMLNAGERRQRPGGTVSGIYAVHARRYKQGYIKILWIAETDALSVTTNLTINFMRKAPAGSINRHCHIKKLM